MHDSLILHVPSYLERSTCDMPGCLLCTLKSSASSSSQDILVGRDCSSRPPFLGGFGPDAKQVATEYKGLSCLSRWLRLHTHMRSVLLDLVCAYTAAAMVDGCHENCQGKSQTL